MPRIIVLLSGEIAVGKTTLCEALVKRFGFHVFKTRELIQVLQSVPAERGALQKAGEELDKKTKGTWVAEALGKSVRDLKDSTNVIVDSVRIKQQIDCVRKAFGSRVVHIHLTADVKVRGQWYEARRETAKIQELPSYEEAHQDPTEMGVSKLAHAADIVIDTDRCTRDDVLVRVASRLGLYGKRVEPLVDVLVGGQYGSEGKGHIASYLAPEYDYLLRVGGPNAGHKIFEDGKPYTHHQLPSGTRKSEAGLIIGPGAVLDVQKLMTEIAECRVAYDRLSVDPRAMLIEKEDIAFEKENSRRQSAAPLRASARLPAGKFCVRRPSR